MPKAHKWRPIEDLAADPKSLTDGELDSLHRVWMTERKALSEEGTLEEFEKRLRREWSIETGIIENVYTLDRGVTRNLIAGGIDAALIPHGASNRDPTLVARIIQDHYDALDTMFDLVGGQREFSTGYVNWLHVALLRNQDSYSVVDQFGQAFEKKLEKGEYKKEANSPTKPDGSIHEYCPPVQVASEMDRLVSLHAEHAARNVPVEVEAAWLHHRFSQIHPFADGNGRVARAITSLVFIKAGWFPLIVKRDDWDRYIDALEAADAGDLRTLVALFVEAQRRAFMLAAEAVYEAKPPATQEEAIAAVRQKLLRKGIPAPEWGNARGIAQGLADRTHNRFGRVADELKRQLGAFGSSYLFDSSRGGLPEDRELQSEAINLAGDIPNLEGHRDLVKLHLGSGSQLVVSFHAVGFRFRGLIGVVPYLLKGDRKPAIVKSGTFQINYAESIEDAWSRFSPWLERVILEVLNEWRRSL